MHIHPTRRSVQTLCLALALAGGTVPAFGGPAEDYALGYKTYGSGDVVTALPPLRRAAEAGHAKAQALLAEILADSDFGEEARVYYRKAAEQGEPSGQFGLAGMLISGQGGAKDAKEARSWLRKAAELDYNTAVREMGHSYVDSVWERSDEERKSPEALKWVQKAAEAGSIKAMEALAAAYRSGEWGLTVSTKTADQWDDKARKARGIKGRRAKSGDKQ